MQFIPEIKLGLINGWLLLILFYGVFGFLLLSFPKSVVARLYDRSGWSQKTKILSAVGKVVILAWFLCVTFTPLKMEGARFILGILGFALGLIGLVMALLNYKDASLDQPATSGLYRISRNPQQVTIFVAFFGLSFIIGSWLAVILISIGAVWGHVRVLAEEESCLAQYGAAYRSYMERVPRYFIFF